VPASETHGLNRFLRREISQAEDQEKAS
jgi:hypothetical protein